MAEENIGSYTCEVPTSEYQLGLCRVKSESGGKYLHNNNTEREMLHFYSSLHVCVFSQLLYTFLNTQLFSHKKPENENIRFPKIQEIHMNTIDNTDHH